MTLDTDVSPDDDQLHRVVLDGERSLFCLRTSDPRGRMVWEWWALDTRDPLHSRRGIAHSAEAAKRAARAALTA